MSRCPKSPVTPNEHGQPPSITWTPCSRPHPAASSETLPLPKAGDAARDRVQVGEGRIDLVRVRVDGVRLVAAIAEALVDDIRAVALPTGGEPQRDSTLDGEGHPPSPQGSRACARARACSRR
jgi:hypothetical protein